MKPTGSQIVRNLQAAAIEIANTKSNDGTMLVEVEFEVFGELQGEYQTILSEISHDLLIAFKCPSYE